MRGGLGSMRTAHGEAAAKNIATKVDIAPDWR
jgi:hypothetical protein